MGLLQEGDLRGISERSLILQQQLYGGENSLFTDGKAAGALIETSKNHLGKGVPLYDQKILQILTTRRDAILTVTGHCTDSDDSRLFLELAYEAATEPDEHKKLLKYINLANEVIDRGTLNGRNDKFDTLNNFEPNVSLMAVTEGALILFNKTGVVISQDAKKLLARATVKVMSTEYLPANPSFAYALTPVLDELLIAEDLLGQK